jgi:hypothetical protein
MLNRIRSALRRTQPQQTYTTEDLQRIGQTLKAERASLDEVRKIPIKDLERTFRQATGL